MADLARRPGVELARTGTWNLGTGTWNATPADFAAAIAATACPAVRRPYLRIGHLDQRFTPRTQAAAEDGEPAVGWIENLRLGDGGHTLIGDYVGVPAWLDSIMATAYPDRSIEGTYNRRCQLGHTHPFVLDGLALLGITRPGVGTLRSLNDVRTLFDVAAEVELADDEVRIAAAIPGAVLAAAEPHEGAMVALIPTGEHAARLAVEGGEAAEQLHVTLAYLGKAVDLSPAVRQNIIAEVAAAVNGMAVVEADAFAISAFNPTNPDRETCIVLGLSGADVDVVHELVEDALGEAPIPAQHSPWHAHLSLIYTDDLGRLSELAARTGPVVFDRVRIAFGGQHIDIPLLSEPEADLNEVYDDQPELVNAAANDNKLRQWWVFGPGRSKWSSWTELYRQLREHVGAARAKRIAASWFRLRYGYWPGDRRNRVHAQEGSPMPNPTPAHADRVRAAWNAKAPVETWIVEVGADHVIVIDERDRHFDRVPIEVDGDQVAFGEPVKVKPGYVEPELVAASVVYASRGESRPDEPDATQPVEPEPTPEPVPPAGPTPPDEADPELPAAEPEPAQPTEPTEEDTLSTLNADVRSRLGLADDADDTAILAALDALKTKADTPPQPDPELVAASAAARDEMRTQIEALSTELATIKASAAASEKKALFETALTKGKIRPADRADWEARYDRAPEVIAEILASTADYAAVPTKASGYTGDSEPTGDDAVDVPDDIAGLFSTPFAKES